jgi:hypothetical protein
MPIMDQRSVQNTIKHQDANNALIALARLLGRQAANELVETEQADPVTPLNQDQGARDD